MACGSRIVINDKGITIITGGKFEVKAGQHIFKSGEQVVSHFPVLPESKGIFNLSVQLIDNQNAPYKNKAYFAISESGRQFEGMTDENGYTQRIYTQKEEQISFHLLENHDYPDPVPPSEEDTE
ncbi:hypothetical protein [Acinetobacter calcoaceticus]|uniref:hypothetical protein n=1 Tax=Acinetobacter calcoaceticus TaxID=471 RepID=UPI002274935D|nr:hypothetical protein [Acinetobacter calcoaceticus]GLG82224.1 hypothetical protein ACSO1_07460 [Acinetobacter calcoaceticus]